MSGIEERDVCYVNKIYTYIINIFSMPKHRTQGVRIYNMSIDLQ